MRPLRIFWARPSSHPNRTGGDDPSAFQGISTSRISIGLVRRARKAGSSASADLASSACTRHQIAWPPARQLDAARRWRSGLWKPVQAANAAAHSDGVCSVMKEEERHAFSLPDLAFADHQGESLNPYRPA